MELEIKRSRFLGRAAPLRTEEAVQAWLAATRAAHPDANHHCFAYRLGVSGDAGRFSDDGEPGGTAGRPIMEVLLREALVDVAVVVTRYFGGVLLGAGGLTRAYSQSAAGAVRAAGFLSMRPHTEIDVTIDYASLGALEQLLLAYGAAGAGEGVCRTCHAADSGTGGRRNAVFDTGRRFDCRGRRAAPGPHHLSAGIAWAGPSQNR